VVEATEPGVSAEGQLHRVYGRGASAQEEHSRPDPGWDATCGSTKDTFIPSRPVGLFRASGRE
jgi:hypothetical protein